MHMANELLSVPVAAGSLAIAAAGLGVVCRKAKRVITSEKLALMGIMGAFVFAAQMVNFQLPAMPGTSGHMVGAVLLAIILGPHMGTIVISSVLIIQCLIFQDGGLLALGCNIINMGLVPCYIGYYLYRSLTQAQSGRGQVYVASVVACVFAIQMGAVLVPIEAALSGVLVVPLATFLITMIGVHLLVGVVEGLTTAAVLGYLMHVRGDIIAEFPTGAARLSKAVVYATIVIFTVVVAAGLSLLASQLPDGLEWSYAERPDEPDFGGIVSNPDTSGTIAAVDDFQSRYSLMPDYSARRDALGAVGDDLPQPGQEPGASWTSFAGVAGSAATMLFIWLAAWFIRRKPQHAGT